MIEYRKEMQALLGKLAEASAQLLDAVPYSGGYSKLLLTRNDLIWRIQMLEENRRQDYIQKKEEGYHD